MNIFLVKINANEIINISQLKTYFRKYIIKLHPDITGKDSQAFLLTYQYYQEAKEFLESKILHTKNNIIDKAFYNKNDMLNLFADLMANNFPLDIKIAKQNKLYQQRIDQMNNIVNTLIKEKNLFILFEKDLNILRGNSIILTHEYNVVISYLNNIRDYVIYNNTRGKKYISNTYDLIIGIAISRKIFSFILYVNWLIVDIIGKQKIKGNLPTTASTG